MLSGLRKSLEMRRLSTLNPQLSTAPNAPGCRGCVFRGLWL
jgi:hypothetical protein